MPRFRDVVCVLISTVPVTALAVTPEASVTAIARTLAYDEGLSRRLQKEPLPVLALGVPCAQWPTTTRIAGHTTVCEPVALKPGLVDEAAARNALLLLGELDPAQAHTIISQARDAQVPVVGVGVSHASTDVLLVVDGVRLYIGEQAAKRLGARFPTSVLKLATIVSAASVGDEEPTLRESWTGGTYPEEAINANVEGPVQLRIAVDEAGRVTDAVVTKGLGFGLDEEAVRRVKRFKFNPGKRNGRVVGMTTNYTIRFALQD